MAQVSQRAGFSGSTLIRLLARLSGSDAREATPATADRLSQWFSWTDAIALSTALNGSPATAAPAPAGPASAQEAECARVRAALANALRAPVHGEPVDTAAGFAPHRQRYLAKQQAMEASIGPLRERMRAALEARSPAMARLAAVDAVMAQVLDAREHSLLATVPAVLEKHFERLRQTAPAAGEPGTETQPEAWLETFRKDSQDVLLAELDFRFQPVEGLLEALRMRQPG
jgi:hypothetical protein